jgi:hypothetical protein
MTDVPQGMIEAKRRAEQELLERPGVIGVGVGLAESDGALTDAVAIKVYVEPGHEVASQLPDSIEGHPVNVVERRILPQPQTLELKPAQVGADGGSYDPLVGGISIGPCRYFGASLTIVGGTLGAVVIDKASGKPMLLSNYHVLAVDKEWKAGDEILQPSLIDKVVPLCSGLVGSLSRAQLGGSVDCAVAAQTDLDFDWSIVEIGPISGTVAAALNMHVSKRGRTTLLTHGKISATSITVIVDYGYDVGEVTLTDQIEVAADPSTPVFSDHGDSGSVVVNDAGAVVGLLFAGSDPPACSYLNPIGAVTEALGVAMPSSDEVLTLKNKQTLDDRASGATVLATAEGRPLTMTFAGTNGAINIQTSTDGVTFANKVVLPEKTYTEPALVLAPAGSGQADYIAWRGEDGNNSLNIASLGPNWSIATHYTLAERSDANPALAFYEGVLVLAWKGRNNTSLNIATSSDGGKTFPNKIVTSQRSSHGPWLCHIDEDLYLVWQGGGDWPNIAQVTSVSPLTLGFPTVINTQQTSYHPSLALAGELLLAWRGTDSHSKINVAISREGMSFRQQVVFGESTAASPMLCAWHESLYIAWTGTDDKHNINFAELAVPTDG